MYSIFENKINLPFRMDLVYAIIKIPNNPFSKKKPDKGNRIPMPGKSV